MDEVGTLRVIYIVKCLLDFSILCIVVLILLEYVGTLCIYVRKQYYVSGVHIQEYRTLMLF